MKTLSQTLLLAGLSTLFALIAPSQTQAGNDTLRMISGENVLISANSRVRLFAQGAPSGYFRTLMHRPSPEVQLYLPPLHSRLLAPRWIPLGPAGMPVQDFVFTRFMLAKSAKRR